MTPIPMLQRVRRRQPKTIESSELATDEVLVRSILNDGSETAFRALYNRYVSRLYHVAFRILQSSADSEDAVQETWLRAMLKLREFEWRSALGTWLTGITVNVAREQLQRRGRWNPVELTEDVGIVVPVADTTDLERAIAQLPPGARAAFVLHDVEGFTHEEIAESLGWTSGTSKTQLFRARRALRRMIGEA
jgi:RNA polymerase sigma-70 factor (ECF subfamily)